MNLLRNRTEIFQLSQQGCAISPERIDLLNQDITWNVLELDVVQKAPHLLPKLNFKILSLPRFSVILSNRLCSTFFNSVGYASRLCTIQFVVKKCRDLLYVAMVHIDHLLFLPESWSVSFRVVFAPHEGRLELQELVSFQRVP